MHLIESDWRLKNLNSDAPRDDHGTSRARKTADHMGSARTIAARPHHAQSWQRRRLTALRRHTYIALKELRSGYGQLCRELVKCWLSNSKVVLGVQNDGAVQAPRIESNLIVGLDQS